MTATQLQTTEHAGWLECGPALEPGPSPPTVPFTRRSQPEPEPEWQIVPTEQELAHQHISAIGESSAKFTRDTIVDIDITDPKVADLPLLDVRRPSPLRPPAWRWLRALALRATATKPTRRHDCWYLSTLMRFQEALAKCQSDEDISRVAYCKPGLYEAYETYYAESESCRVELEARILAREGREQIARKLAMPADAIVWYERAFFNVSDRLDAPSFIVRNCLDGNVHELQGEEDLGVLIRLVGYRLGTAALDDVLYGFSGRERPGSRSELAQVFDSSVFRKYRVKMALVVHLAPVDDPKAAARLFKLFLRLRALEERREHRQREHADITKNIDVAYDRLISTLAHADGPPYREPSAVTNNKVSGNEQLGPIPEAFLPLLAVGMPREGHGR